MNYGQQNPQTSQYQTANSALAAPPQIAILNSVSAQLSSLIDCAVNLNHRHIAFIERIHGPRPKEAVGKEPIQPCGLADDINRKLQYLTIILQEMESSASCLEGIA